MSDREATEDRSVLVVNGLVTGLLMSDQESTGRTEKEKTCYDKQGQVSPHKAQIGLPRNDHDRNRERDAVRI
jgi:hypothetical protein